MPPLPKKPADELRSLAAPHELVEWVRKLPADTASRSAWVDAPRADWVPYLAVLRGIQRETILKAVCETALEIAPVGDEPQMARLLAVLRDGTTRGRDAFLTALADLDDLRRAVIAHGTTAPQAVWMFWAELVFELARSQGRGNPLLGIALAMRMLATSKGRVRPNVRPGHTDLVARLRDKLTLAM